MSGLKARPTWKQRQRRRQTQIPCGNGKQEEQEQLQRQMQRQKQIPSGMEKEKQEQGQRQKQKTNTGISPLRRQSAPPPVEMTAFGVRFGRATADADSLREWKLEEQKQRQIPAEWKTRGAKATAKAKSQYRGLSTAAAKCKVLRLRSGSR